MWNVVLAQTAEAPVSPEAPAGEAAQRAPGVFGSPFVMIALFLMIMYFFLLRPGQKREKERRDMLAALGKGDQVVTTGGICGTVVGLKEKTVVLCVDEDDNIKMEFLRGAISQIVARADDPKKS